MAWKKTEEVTPRHAAVTAGIALIVMTAAAGFSAGVVHGSLIAAGDPAGTVRNLVESQMLFRAGIFGWLVILLTDLVVAWALYLYFEPVNRGLSLLCGWLRLSYAGILGIAIACLVIVLVLIGGAGSVSAPQSGDLSARAALLIDGFDEIWSIGLVVFGGHLLLLGYLALVSGFVPRVIGILLLIAAVSYVGIPLSYLLLPAYEEIISVAEKILSVPMTAELVFAVWLLIRGGKAVKKV
ncbi:MAG: DUF4386 domain-containing protein [Sediminispirochaetaceae bacterium]